jgi:Family of unknown function (DUF6496)
MPTAGLSPKEVVHQELHKFKRGALHSGSKEGPKVTSRDQAIAIALSEARRARRAFGGPSIQPPKLGSNGWMVRNEARSMLHSGPIGSAVPGRTDRHNVKVGSGSYVLPADHVSALGQNNTKAGHAILNAMFGQGGPYGTKGMAVKHGAGAPKPPGLGHIGAPKAPKLVSAGGGKGDHVGHPVDVVVAGGEYTIPAEVVQEIGGGDIKRGHKILDDWVLSTRKKHIKTLQKLPGPAKA